jgi:ADP-heptose:LPS heptosyltransferase
VNVHLTEIINRGLGKFGKNIIYFYQSWQNAILKILAKVIWFSDVGKDVKVVCIHRVGQIGDMFCSFSAIHLIRRRYPNSHLILLTSPGLSLNLELNDLLCSISWIDEVITYKSSLSQLVSLQKTLIGKKIDLWVSLPQDRTTFFRELRSMLFARLVCSGRGTGFSVNVVPLFERFQSREFSLTGEVERLRRIAGADYASCVKENLFLLEDEVSNSEKLIEDLRLNKNKPVMILAPGSNRETNRWPINNFVEIARRWVKEGGQVLLVGGIKDTNLGKQIILGNSYSDVFDFIGKLSLKQTVMLMRIATVFVGNDSGPMHIAAYANTPCVIAFSARDYPIKWYPAGSAHTIVRKDVDCSPCVAEVCRRDNLCMKLITIEEVWNGVAKQSKRKYIH